MCSLILKGADHTPSSPHIRIPRYTGIWQVLWLLQEVWLTSPREIIRYQGRHKSRDCTASGTPVGYPRLGTSPPSELVWLEVGLSHLPTPRVGLHSLEVKGRTWGPFEFSGEEWSDGSVLLTLGIRGTERQHPCHRADVHPHMVFEGAFISSVLCSHCLPLMNQPQCQYAP